MTPERNDCTREMFDLMGRFARSLGHDLRNPLSLVSHAVYLLRMQLDQREPQATATLDVINTAISDAEHILDGLRDFVCAAPPERSPYHLLDIVATALAQVNIPETITQNVIAPQDLPIVLVDGDQLLVAFRNLVEYCVSAMPEAGILTITLAFTEPDNVDIEFAHSGNPLPDDHLADMFNPFAAVPVYGTGLKLPLVQLLIENLDGSITSSSGTTFLIHLRASGVSV